MGLERDCLEYMAIVLAGFPFEVWLHYGTIDDIGYNYCIPYTGY